jgi:hypothetical protein
MGVTIEGVTIRNVVEHRKKKKYYDDTHRPSRILSEDLSGREAIRTEQLQN